MDYYSGFKSKYTDQKNKALEEYANREPFEFNADTSKLYNTYKKHYDAAGKQAMKDTIGQATALSGGYNNSYAEQVGQQTYNSYMSELESMLPEFEEQAYNRYENEGNKLLNYYEILKSAEDDEYSKFIDERNYNYQLSRDAVADEQWNKEYYASLYGGNDEGASETSSNITYTGETKTNDNGQTMYKYIIDGEEQWFAEGVSPRGKTGHPDAKNGVFKNGYQPNNVKGNSLKYTGEDAYVNGQWQKVWYTIDGNGTEHQYVWRGDWHDYEELTGDDMVANLNKK